MNCDPNKLKHCPEEEGQMQSNFKNSVDSASPPQGESALLEIAHNAQSSLLTLIQGYRGEIVYWRERCAKLEQNLNNAKEILAIYNERGINVDTSNPSSSQFAHSPSTPFQDDNNNNNTNKINNQNNNNKNNTNKINNKNNNNNTNRNDDQMKPLLPRPLESPKQIDLGKQTIPPKLNQIQKGVTSAPHKDPCFIDLNNDSDSSHSLEILTEITKVHRIPSPAHSHLGDAALKKRRVSARILAPTQSPSSSPLRPSGASAAFLQQHTSSPSSQKRITIESPSIPSLPFQGQAQANAADPKSHSSSPAKWLEKTPRRKTLASQGSIEALELLSENRANTADSAINSPITRETRTGKRLEKSTENRTGKKSNSKTEMTPFVHGLCAEATTTATPSRLAGRVPRSSADEDEIELTFLLSKPKKTRSLSSKLRSALESESDNEEDLRFGLKKKQDPLPPVLIPSLRASTKIDDPFPLTQDHPSQSPRTSPPPSQDFLMRRQSRFDQAETSPVLQQAPQEEYSLVDLCDDKSDTKPRATETNPHKFRDVVRKKKDREDLPAQVCPMCAQWYEAVGAGYSIDDLLQRCSRHRARDEAPSTPTDYWKLSFPVDENNNDNDFESGGK